MAIETKPEVLPPLAKDDQRKGGWRGRAGETVFSDARLDLLSHLLDDFIRVPGTPIRFGLDGIVGFVPGLGDVVGGLASTIIIVAAWVRGVPERTLLRMVLNVGIETAAGSVPFLGNLFDIGWRANRRNYALLTEALGTGPPREAARRKWRDRLFLAGICLVLMLLVAVPVVLAGLVVVWVKHLLWPGRG